MEAFSELTMFDVVIISIILISSLLAFIKGFVSAVLSFTNWVVSFMLVIYATPVVAVWLGDVVDSEQTAKVFASALVFITSFIFFAILNGQIIRLVRSAGIGSIDRTLGLAFGMVRGVLIGVVIFLSVNIGFNMLSADSEKASPEWLKEAKSYNLLQAASGILVEYIPDDKFQEAQDKIKEIGSNAPALLGGLTAGSSLENNSFLSSEEGKLMDRAIAALPPYEIQQLVEKYGENISNMTDLEKRAFYKEIFRLYEDGAAMGVVPVEKRLTRQEYNELYKALQRAPVDEGETGYKPRQLDDINRLIDTVE